MLSSELFTNVTNDGNLVYEKRNGGYRVGIVRHQSEKSTYHLAYVAVPKSSRFFGKDYEDVDGSSIEIFFTYSDYSEDGQYWILGFESSAHNIDEAVEISEKALKFFIGG